MFNPSQYHLTLPPNRRQLAPTRISKVRALLARVRSAARPAVQAPVGPGRRQPVAGRLFTPIHPDVREPRTVRDTLSLITVYAQRRKLIQLTYRRIQDGAIVQRLVEPYSLRFKRTRRGGRARYFFAFDTSPPTTGIHSFRMSNILAVLGTNRSFRPRWKVEF